MFSEPIQKLIDAFKRLPGIGPRQAARFAFFILHDNYGASQELTLALKKVQEDVSLCGQCYRAMEKKSSSDICEICRDSKRSPNLISVVEKEADLFNIEQTGDYAGMYHVLSGTLDPLDSDSPRKMHIKNLYDRVKNVLAEQKATEIILATSSTSEGDATALYIERVLHPLKDSFKELKITRLGRGLSLGQELEYADRITLKNALKNRA